MPIGGNINYYFAIIIIYLKIDEGAPAYNLIITFFPGARVKTGNRSVHNNLTVTPKQ